MNSRLAGPLVTLTRLFGGYSKVDDVSLLARYKSQQDPAAFDELVRLAAVHRDPLILCYIKGFSRDEAATRLGISTRTLTRRLDKGRERLRLRLAKRGVGSIGLEVFVLSPAGLTARVPEGLTK